MKNIAVGRRTLSESSNRRGEEINARASLARMPPEGFMEFDFVTIFNKRYDISVNKPPKNARYEDSRNRHYLDDEGQLQSMTATACRKAFGRKGMQHYTQVATVRKQY